MEEGWQVAEGSDLLTNDVFVVYLTEASYKRQKELRAEREVRYEGLPLKLSPSLSMAALLID